MPALSTSFKFFPIQFCRVIPSVFLAVLHHTTQLTTPLLCIPSSVFDSWYSHPSPQLPSISSATCPIQQKLHVLHALCILLSMFSTSVFYPASWGKASTSGTDMLAGWLVHVWSLNKLAAPKCKGQWILLCAMNRLSVLPRQYFILIKCGGN